jgi:hypothetical protein
VEDGLWRHVVCGLAIALAALAVSPGTLPTFAQQNGEWTTYMVNGKQYIVVGVGWEGQPAELIALGLP